MRALVFLTLLTAVACAPDVPVDPADTAAADADDDLDAALVPGTDALGELPHDVVVKPDVAPDVVVVDVFIDPCTGLSCDDGNVCTSDTCSAGTCLHLPASGNCTDGNTCTVGDTCKDGLCLPGAVTACSDGLACTVDSCSPAVGCAWVVSATCDDGDPCTLEGCAKSGCTHGVASCDDKNVCTSDVCDSMTGCSHVPIANCCLDKYDCDDAKDCTLDACEANSCGHTVKVGASCWTGGTCDAQGSCVLDAPMGMVLIPSGTFWMGCNSVKDSICSGFPAEAPQHKVTLSPYYVDLTETTVGHYKACVDAGVCTVPSAVEPEWFATYPSLTDHPINNVTWMQSQQYCKWRGAAFDLPTEAQWEMAARGSCEKNGSAANDPGCAAAMRTYPWGEAVATCSYAIMAPATTGYACGTNATWPVGSLPQGDSPYGLHDMAGNVLEWNRDWFTDTFYAASPQLDPLETTATPLRVVRGGGFDYVASDLRAGARMVSQPTDAFNGIGFRCVRSYP